MIFFICILLSNWRSWELNRAVGHERRERVHMWLLDLSREVAQWGIFPLVPLLLNL
jgi:hypothetical protein